jgi:hypothetical protein
MVSMDVEPDREKLFNEVYDEEHVPTLMRVPGVLSVVRYERHELTMAIGGQVKQMPVSHPKYHALYEVESPEVLVGDAWAKSIELGRWPEQVRPFTMNRQHLLAKRRGE